MINLVIVLVVWTIWGISAFLLQKIYLFEHNWPMSITMLFGSFIAGATSEGGGAVAFPVMTLGFKISPSVARDFSLIIQSVGMTCASLVIFFKKITIERTALIYSFLGGVIGIIVGFKYITGMFSPSFVKIFFTSFWLSFIFVLFYLNKEKNRLLFDKVGIYPLAKLGLFIAGFFGGILTSLTGSGIDIITFSFLVLAFRINEKVATATSVVLMGTTALLASIWKGAILNDISPLALDYWWVCVPIVVIGAPFGASMLKFLKRKWIVYFLYLSILVQYIFSIIIIPHGKWLTIFNITVLVFGMGLFTGLRWIGNRAYET